MAASWLGTIWVLTVLWAVVSLRMKPAWRLSVSVRVGAGIRGRSGRSPAGWMTRPRAWRRTDRREGEHPGLGVLRYVPARCPCAGGRAGDPGPDLATVLIRDGDASTRSNRLAARGEAGECSFEPLTVRVPARPAVRMR